MEKIIRVEHLDFHYQNHTIFTDFSFSVDEGSYIAISGPNESGKTTLMRLLTGYLPSKNKIVIGYQYIDSSQKEEIFSKLGIVSNEERSFLYESVYRELCFPLENLNMPKDQMEKRIIETCQKLQITNLLDKKIQDLTKSQKQKLKIALAIIHHPAILLLDQPFQNLNRQDTIDIKRILKELNQQEHVTILLFSQNLEDTLDADYLYILYRGKWLMEGKPLVVMREDKLLNRIGLKLPFMVDLSLKLEFYEVLDEIILDMERMVNTLWK